MQNLENPVNNTKEFELFVWEQVNNGLLRQTILTVIQNQMDEVTCVKNGIILQFKKEDLTDDLKITKSLMKINHLKWKGKEGKEKQKIGKWVVYWKNKEQNIGGYYDDQGRKQGLWREEYENFQDYAQIVYVGIYHNGIQRDRWDTILNNNIIGGGNYDHNGKKTGKWVELHLNYFKQNYAYCDATYEGEYLEGRKQGYWQTFLSKTIIGGGFYNEDGQKNGFWIELNDYFQFVNQVIYKGNYKNGLQIGIWEILIVYDKKQIYIGGGAFDDNGNKNGRWVDLALDWLNGNKEIFYIGDYKNGQKIGQWNIHNWYNKSIGGGEFEEGVKNGQWIELHDNWHQKWPQISYHGNYQNGKKNGRWDTYDNYDGKDKYIGGGSFQGGIKDGIWIDVHDEWRPHWRSITYHGEYQMGKKIGTWKILDGGGDYNENGMKNGKWFEPDEKWQQQNLEFIYEGEYKNGLKIGQWNRIDNLNGINNSLCEYYSEDGLLIENEL